MLKQKGLSLVELMIAMTLGLVLLLGVTKVFLSSKNVYSSQQALSRVQETGRMAIDFMARDIRMAGYFGCASRSADMTVTNTLNTPTTVPYDFGTAVIGYTSATFPTGTVTPLQGDVLVVRGVTGTGTQIVQNNDSAQLFANNTGVESAACAGGTDRISGLCQGDILVVSDCSKARVFQATNITDAGGGKVNVVHSGAAMTPGNATTSWGGSGVNALENFLPGAQILSATSTVYYIANGTGGRPSLFQSINGGTGLELLEGVENMNIRYGFSDGTYSNAATVTAASKWSSVQSVRIELLISSIEDRVASDKQSYVFGLDVSGAPKTNTATDYRLRQVFTSTVGIRSRLD